MVKKLTSLILMMLQEESRSGYDIQKHIEERTGWKPSFGAIYPQLEALEEAGHVTVEADGRSKTYTITESGRKQAKDNQEQCKELLGQIVERMKILQELTDEDLSMPIEFLSQKQETGVNPFHPVKKETEHMRAALLRLWKESLIQEKRTEISRILTKTAQELNDL